MTAFIGKAAEQHPLRDQFIISMYTCKHVAYIKVYTCPLPFPPFLLGGSVTCHPLPCQKGQQLGSAPLVPSGGPEDEILGFRPDFYHKQCERDKVSNSGHFPAALHACDISRIRETCHRINIAIYFLFSWQFLNI